MSYCRMHKNSDVYMIDHFEHGPTCYSCKLTVERETVVLGNPQDAWSHLYDHTEAGHKVPQHAFTRLWYEIKIERIEAAHKAEIDRLNAVIDELKRGREHE